MAATLVKSVMLKIAADDGNTQQKLERISAEADRLGREHPELKVRVDAAAASAKMAVLRKELKGVNDENSKSPGILRQAFMGWSGFGSVMTAASGDASMMQKAMAGLSLATGLLEPLAAGAIVGVGAIGAAAVSAGTGLGVFGLVAKSVYSKVSTALSAYTTAQQQAQKATTAAGRTAALRAEKVAFDGLTTSQKHFATALTGAKSDWSKFVSSASPGVTSVMAAGLRLLPAAIKLMRPFLAPVERALHGIVGEIKSAAASPFWKSFDHMLAGHAGTDIMMIAQAIGHVIKGLAGIVKAFTPVSTTVLGGLDKLTGSFAKWGTSLSSHSGFKSLMTEATKYAPAIASSMKNIGSAAVHLIGDMAGTKSLVPVWAALLPPVTKFLDTLIKANPGLVQFGLYALAAGKGVANIGKGFQGIQAGFNAVKSAGSMISGLATKMGLLQGATEGETVAQEGLDGAMDANPIGIIVLAIAGLVVGIVELWKHSTGFRNFWKGAWKDIKTAAVDAWHFLDNDVIHPIEHGIGDVVDFVRTHWKMLAVIIATVLLGPVAGLVAFIATHWHQITSLTGRLVGDVVGFFRRLPGDILHALGDLGSLLVNAGEAIIHGFLHGLTSAWHDVTSFIGGIGSWISSHKGPIEADRLLLVPHGKAIIQGLQSGMLGQMPGLRRTLTTLADAIANGLHDGLLSRRTAGKLGSALQQQMANIRQYAAGISSAAVSSYDISQITAPNGQKLNADVLLHQMHMDLGQIRRFGSNIKKLAREGLSRELLRQLLAAGPASAAPVAQALANANLGEIRAISRTESSIQGMARHLGGVGAGAVYGSAAGQQQIILDFRHAGGGAGLDHIFWTWMKKMIRAHGGDPNIIGR